MKAVYLSLALFAGVLARPAVEATAATCHDYVLIQSRGTAEPQGPSESFVNMTSWTLGNVTNGIEYNTVYPADVSQLSAPIGAQNVIQYIQNGSAACPSQKYALMGYSQGASVTVMAIKNLTGTKYEPLISAVVVTGDPYQIPNQNITIDQNGGTTSRNGTGSALILDPSLGFSQHWVDSGKVQQFCFYGDPVCDVAKLLTLNVTPHTLYGTTKSVQNLGAQFLISHLKQ